MYFVYILQSQFDGSHYVGCTANPDERLSYHNNGLVDSTKSKRPWQRVWLCSYTDKTKALAFERYLKSGSGIAFMRKRLL